MTHFIKETPRDTLAAPKLFNAHAGVLAHHRCKAKKYKLESIKAKH